ncbi:hypothetical protein [Polynucleobacter sp. CS-Odin-A6]|uniref:hypothetical protein n=1 Tax=Polynucleobacter sp. CS-Odin-A6 TaxID=2689106 RepID=UPI001C0CD0AF|nr:hypothetical protein [Polynucleobacter sp. CS-Odin-A6]MBU3621031.1 hypothetical protein [Polynucleobacter sp. CS-Odin-A6]
MKKSNGYIRFLDLVEILQAKSKIRTLDSTEKHLLNNIMLDDSVGNPIFVGDLLRLKLLGSQATLHGRLKNLRSIGYIKLIEQDDARKKRVMPTTQAYKLFELLSGCMARALKES